MANNDLDAQIERLAVAVEEQISENEAFLMQLDSFSERSERSKKLRRSFKGNSER